jgi:hypothetical protein
MPPAIWSTQVVLKMKTKLTSGPSQPTNSVRRDIRTTSLCRLWGAVRRIRQTDILQRDIKTRVHVGAAYRCRLVASPTLRIPCEVDECDVRYLHLRRPSVRAVISTILVDRGSDTGALNPEILKTDVLYDSPMNL